MSEKFERKNGGLPFGFKFKYIVVGIICIPLYMAVNSKI